MKTAALFKWSYYQAEFILLSDRLYCRYTLSYLDLEDMMMERRLEVDPSTINRWVLKSAVKKSLCIYIWG